MADVITQGETMNRLIHQAVRRDLGRFEAALDALAPGDRSRAAALGEAFAHFDTMLTHHHEGEEHNLWPVIGDPAGGHEGDVATLTHEHEEIVAGLADSRAASRGCGTSARPRTPRTPPPGSRGCARPPPRTSPTRRRRCAG